MGRPALRRGVALAIALSGLASPALADWVPTVVSPQAVADAALIDTPDFTFRLPRSWRPLADADRPPGAMVAFGARSVTEDATFTVYRRASRPRYVREESRLWVLERPQPSDSFDLQVLDGAVGFVRSHEQLPTDGHRMHATFQRGATGYDLVFTWKKALTTVPIGAMIAVVSWRWTDAALGDGDRCRAWAVERDRNIADARGLFELLMSPPLCAYPDEPTIREAYLAALSGTEHYLSRYYARKLTALGCPP